MRPAFSQDRTFHVAKSLGFSVVTCLGRRTISGLICTQGAQYQDWGKIYRLFEHSRFDKDKLFEPLQRAVVQSLPQEMPVVAVLDDTICPKKGKKVAGASWRRDSSGPHFTNNFVWAQRFVQMSLIAPMNGFGSNGRAIPVDFVHAPTARKPRRHSLEEEWERYRAEQKQKRVSKVGSERIQALRARLDTNVESKSRKLIVSIDGGYTNREVFANVPEQTALIGRIRRDAKLFGIPESQNEGRGRKRIYGQKLPTPEEIRQDETIAWQKVKAYAAGQEFEFEVKTIKSVRWKSAGGRDMQLMVVRPIGYRPSKKSRILYREPAYLICTDNSMSADQMLQSYLWRWEIEVNFKEEKTLLGLGQAQVRTLPSVESTSAFVVACYGVLQTAALKMGISRCGLPAPKWRSKVEPRRCTTTQLISRVRAETWAGALGMNKSGFDEELIRLRSHQNSNHNLKSAVLYATQ